MTIFLLRLCFISACSNILLNDNQLNLVHAYIHSKRTQTTPLRSRSRRNNTAPDSPPSKGRRRKALSLARNPLFLQHLSQSFVRSKIAPRRPPPHVKSDAVRDLGDLANFKFNTMDVLPLRSAPPGSEAFEALIQTRSATAASETVLPPAGRPRVSSSCTDDDLDAPSVRSGRSNSSTTNNRLSLTLPIPVNLPTSAPTRPKPAPCMVPSYPATPIDTPNVQSPTDSNGFITAIAAQERRVLELREELALAEKELRRVKRQFEHHEAYKKRQEARHPQPLRIVPPQGLEESLLSFDDDSATASKRTAELERRKAILLGGQHSAPGTPGTPGTPSSSSRRRVFHGGHTRQLSLLSPTKSENGFSVHEDAVDQLRTSSRELDEQFANIVRYAPITPAQLSKRASWAPRTVHQQAASGVKQIAEDFRTGLWTFVEDLRQATVGDEPITGGAQPRQGGPRQQRPSGLAPAPSFADEQETIRASTPQVRTHVSRAFEEAETPSPTTRYTDALKDEPDSGGRHKRTSSKQAKRFSWTPLTMDSLDDNDWMSWESPAVAPAKSPRWSGSTVTGDTIPEKLDENETKQSEARKGHSSNPSTSKLEEMSWQALNRLTPSKLKQQATDYLKELERSLTPPGAAVAVEDDGRALMM